LTKLFTLKNYWYLKLLALKNYLDSKFGCIKKIIDIEKLLQTSKKKKSPKNGI
jgi:hypothetical protein